MATLMKKFIEEVLTYFPEEIRTEIIKFNDIFDNLEEIRLRTNRNIILKTNQNEKVLPFVINTEQILEILQRICDNSIYTYQSQICNGFITIKGRPQGWNIWKCGYKRWASN